MADIAKLWRRLEEWAAENAPAMVAELAPPATPKEIEEVEKRVGKTLPASFKSCLSIHNGETDGWPSRVFAERGAFLSTQRIVKEWESRRAIAGELDDPEDPDQLIRDEIIDVVGPIKPVMFDDAWIPIMDCNGDVFWALDLSPADGGDSGQVIEVDWEGCLWEVIASSFEDFMEDYVVALESGEFRVEEGLPTREEAVDASDIASPELLGEGELDADPTYFAEQPQSVSVFAVGPAKQDLREVKVSIWPIVHAQISAEIDGETDTVTVSRLPIELTGEINDRSVLEAWTDLEAQIKSIAHLEQLVELSLDETGYDLYMRNYGGEAWCKVDQEEFFSYIGG